MKRFQRAEEWLRHIKDIEKEIDVERGIIKHAEGRIHKLITEEERIYTVISGVENPTYKELLFQRYIIGKTWEEIAEALSYDLRHVYRLHKQAIEAAQNATVPVIIPGDKITTNP